MELFNACEKGDLKKVRRFLKYGANIEAKDDNGLTPLHYACASSSRGHQIRGHRSIVSVLIENGADVNVSDNYGWTPLHRASYKGNQDVVVLLLRQGANIHAQNTFGRTPLHLASQNGHAGVVELLLFETNDANPNVTDNKGKTALQIAQEVNEQDCVEIIHWFLEDREEAERSSSSQEEHKYGAELAYVSEGSSDYDMHRRQQDSAADDESTDLSFADIMRVLDVQDSNELAAFMKREGVTDPSQYQAKNKASTVSVASSLNYSTDGESQLEGTKLLQTITGQPSDSKGPNGGGFGDLGDNMMFAAADEPVKRKGRIRDGHHKRSKSSSSSASNNTGGDIAFDAADEPVLVSEEQPLGSTDGVSLSCCFESCWEVLGAVFALPASVCLICVPDSHEEDRKVRRQAVNKRYEVMLHKKRDKQELECRRQQERELALDVMRLQQEEKGQATSHMQEEATMKQATTKGRNTLTVLFSEPLIFEDADSNLSPFAKLDLSMERELLKQCLTDASRDIDLYLDSATRRRLLAAKTLRPNCLHYSGHGHETHLPFEDGKGAPHWLDAHLLGDLIAKDEGQPFKFVFVSACHSRKAGEVFIAAGVPHVVCCEQESAIKDAAARDFTFQFYLALAAGHTVKYSFQQGCKAVLATPGLVNAKEEMEKFLLLPEDGDHGVSIFYSREVREWSPTMRSSELQVHNMIQNKLSFPPPRPFLGREIDLYRVLNLVLTKQLVSVIGEKGVGRKSLAYAVCHYINDRRSTMLPTVDSIFFARAARKTAARKTDSNRFLRVLLDLQKQLMLAERGAVFDAMSDDVDSLIHSICDMISEKALLVIDGTDYPKGSAEQQDLVLFLCSLRETRGTKVLLIGLKPLQIPSIHEHAYRVGPLNFANTVQLLSNLCPHLHTRKDHKEFYTRLETATARWNLQGNQDASVSLYHALGDGIPGKIEAMAYSLTSDEIDSLGVAP